ncbi:MAG: OmpA family protein [Lysobacteraceae bacterium]
MKIFQRVSAAACLAVLFLSTACNRVDADKTPTPVADAPAVSSPQAPAEAGTTAAPAASGETAIPTSSDPDAPIALPALRIAGKGSGKAEARYYDFDAGAGQIVVTATAKNAPSGATQALRFGLYDTQANALCSDSHGNTTSDKTVTLNCTVDKAQRLLLRLDLSPESIDYTIELAGPVTLIARQAAASTAATTGAGSTDIDEPTRLQVNRVKADGPGKPASYYYAFNAGPGELTLTGDASNTSAAATFALRLGLYTLRSERLCEVNIGNTTREERAVASCMLDKRQPVIMRVDVSAETVAFRARFDGPYDFEPFEAPKVITIALDSSVLFDTGKSDIKPEASQQLHEAAERIRKFPGATVAISGHTDNVGGAASNLALSKARAESVKAYLTGKESISADALTTQGFGSTQPVADNATDAGKARNRRVDVTITPKP